MRVILLLHFLPGIVRVVGSADYNHVLFNSKNREAETTLRGPFEACFRVSTTLSLGILFGTLSNFCFLDHNLLPSFSLAWMKQACHC
ncbi:unnamed protein product [Prunus armeniaca]